MDTKSIIGKRISYFDGFSNSTSEDTVTQVSHDGDRDGYRIDGSDPRNGFIFLKSAEMATLLQKGKLTRWGSIDNCPYRELITILQG